MYALKFLKEGAVGPYSRFQWPVPNGKPGTWVRVRGGLIECQHGVHACTLEQSLAWLQAEAYVIELGGRVIDGGDKLLARSGRLIRRIEGWNVRTARLFAADCAEHVLPVFEKKRPRNDRPRRAIATARAFAEGKASHDDLNAARAGARATARAGAGAAAWDAAGDAERQHQCGLLRRYLNVPELDKRGA